MALAPASFPSMRSIRNPTDSPSFPTQPNLHNSKVLRLFTYNFPFHITIHALNHKSFDVFGMTRSADVPILSIDTPHSLTMISSWNSTRYEESAAEFYTTCVQIQSLIWTGYSDIAVPAGPRWKTVGKRQSSPFAFNVPLSL
ncbi:hypothetical protein M422DRAFT_262695 [Sphaerobolus stellatus SS14]|uniref:Unplaced genomic scaffold SPHSTscaffold_117, whole genome shotgun sequence n=1 Tax=Sphaerobolus stellatus (strain SS14) TaxID=990650 RepID=A0A0C9VCP9_SPHS4|nr:hypothetical protein M422DRAFT_262695 [Sphaerobolus stellatus SS14]